MWLLRDYTLGLGHCALSKQLRNSVQNSLNSVNSYIMEQHTAAQLTIHKQCWKADDDMMGGGRINFQNQPKLIFVVVSSADKHAV